MDEQRFDAALRALHMGTTRRKGLAGMLGVLLGGAVAGLDASADRRRGGRDTDRDRDKDKDKDKQRGRRGAARRRGGMSDPGVAGPCGSGSGRDNRCASNGDCCTRYCANGACRCKPNWMRCRRGAECCSGACVGRRCDGGAKPAGSACTHNFNCQSGLVCSGGVCTPSPRAKCTARNCQGCCDGTTCRTGKTRQGCGVNAAACAVCLGTAACVAGACGGSPSPGGGCSAATCPNGCCKNGACTDGTSDNACGAGGEECDACTGGDACQAQACSPVCDATTCPNGCCDGGSCETGTDEQACGSGGEACVVCAGSAAPFCVASACAAGTWANQTTFGSSGAGPSNFNSPSGVWVSGDGLTVYVADEQNSRISYWSRPGATGTDAVNWLNDATFGSAGAAATQFNTPPGVFVSVDQRTAWIADWFNHRVSIWTRADTVSAWGAPITIGSQGAGASQFEEPKGVFVSPDGLTLWVSDTGNSRISIWTRPSADSTSWQNQTTFGSSSLSFPNGIFVTNDGLTVFVADHNNSRISIWTRPDASSLTWQNQSNFGTIGTGAADLKLADGVWASQDTLSAWVADTGNNRVSIWTRTSATSTAWTHLANFGTYGSSTTADDKLDGPRSVVLSSDAKTAWISDYGNSRISVWTQT